VEKLTGQTYIDHVRKELLAPLGITSIQLARSLPRFRDPREPFYSDSGRWRSVIDLKDDSLIPTPDGTFCLEMMDAQGGLIGSSVDLIKFLQAYWISGAPRKNDGTERQHYTFFGSLPGTWAMARQRRDGLNIVVLFNQRADESGKMYEAIREVLDSAADQVRDGKNEPRP